MTVEATRRRLSQKLGSRARNRLVAIDRRTGDYVMADDLDELVVAMLKGVGRPPTQGVLRAASWPARRHAMRRIRRFAGVLTTAANLSFRSQSTVAVRDGLKPSWIPALTGISVSHGDSVER